MQLKTFVLSAVLMMAASAVFAQAPTATPTAAATPNEQQARQSQQMAQAALQVALLVDQNKTSEVWDGASPIAKQLVRRDAFVKGIGTDRKTVGAVVARNLAQVTYTESDGKRVPAGIFANVAFATRFANEKQPVRELVSFHLDSDHVWRVSGYTLR